MKIVKEAMNNLQDIKAPGVMNATMYKAKEVSDRKEKETKDLIDPMERKNAKAFVGANKQEFPKAVEVPKVALEESLFEDYNINEGSNPREITDNLLDAVEGGLVSAEDVMMACLKYMSEDEVEDMCRMNDFNVARADEIDEAFDPTTVEAFVGDKDSGYNYTGMANITRAVASFIKMLNSDSVDITIVDNHEEDENFNEDLDSLNLTDAEKEIVDEVSDRYCTSTPVSGDWDKEIAHERDAIAKELNCSKEKANKIMIDYLGFQDQDLTEAKKPAEEKDLWTLVYDELNAGINFPAANADENRIEKKSKRRYQDSDLTFDDNDIIVHVDDPKKLELAKKVAQKFNLETKEEAHPERAKANFRYTLKMTVPMDESLNEGVSVDEVMEKLKSEPLTLERDVFYDYQDNLEGDMDDVIEIFASHGFIREDGQMIIPAGTKLTFTGASNPYGAGYFYFTINDSDDEIPYINEYGMIKDLFAASDRKEYARQFNEGILGTIVGGLAGKTLAGNLGAGFLGKAAGAIGGGIIGNKIGDKISDTIKGGVQKMINPASILVNGFSNEEYLAEEPKEEETLEEGKANTGAIGAKVGDTVIDTKTGKEGKVEKVGQSGNYGLIYVNFGKGLRKINPMDDAQTTGRYELKKDE